MWYKFVFSLLFAIACSTQIAEAQEMNYRIMWKGDSIGYVSSNRFDSMQFEVYRIESRVSIWIFGTKKINYDFYSVFDQDKLLKGTTLSTKNEHVVGKSKIDYKTDAYVMQVDGKEKTYDSKYPVSTSVIELYHTEPAGLANVFSERYGTYLSVTDLGSHHYVIEKPNGRTTQYHYKDGICYLVEVDNFFANIKFEYIELGD